MTQEEIAKQANEYSLQRVRKNERYKALFTKSEIAQAFEDGAEWRINSVWHKPTAYGEELKVHVEVIAHCKSGYHLGEFNAVGSYHEYIGFVSVSGIEFALSSILEYAYLEDLLPDGKEDYK